MEFEIWVTFADKGMKMVQNNYQSQKQKRVFQREPYVCFIT